MQRELTKQDVEDVWAAEFDRRTGGPPEPYSKEDLAIVERGRALRPLVTLHESHRAIIGHATDNANADEIAAKSDSPIIARFAGHIATSEAHKWIGLSWK